MQMAVKRYIATDLPKQAWYMELEPRLKSLWIHLLLTCDIAGSFEVTPRLFGAFIGEEVTEEELFTAFGSRVVKWKDKGLIPAFVRIQYCTAQRQRLSPECRQHQYVLARLKELGLTEAKLDELASREPQMLLALPPPKKEAKPKPQRCVVPPDVEWVREYCSTRNNGVDAQRFCDYYEARGWKVGGRLMHDWQAAVRTWERNERAPAAPKPQNVLDDSRYTRKGKF